MKFFCAFLVCLTSIYCKADVPKPCTAPTQWMGSSSEYDHGDGQHNYYNLTYDAMHHRIRVLEEVRADRPGRTYYEWLFLYDDKTFYELNLQTRDCKKIDPPRPWHAYEIPLNATFEHGYELGSGSAALMVAEWSDRVTAPSQPETWSGTFTVDGCIPVTEVVIQREVNKSFSTVFYNIKPGPLSANAFDPPPECH